MKRAMYNHSEDGEYWIYDDLQSAVENAVYTLPESDFKDGTIIDIYQGDCITEPASYYLPRHFGEMLNEYAYDNVGEVADGWPPVHLEEKLQNALEAFVDDWFTKNECHPEFGLIKNVKTIQIRLVNTDPETDSFDWELIGDAE